ncbi:TonB-dependent receptor [Halieaceae bacterium IMCC14734]|uniref:TonB-dependent receptor n=1 Tax=Candidatus Litorirhabdus singularis TaxID=2518993 RepID=A0ABT3TIZ0_9GAMM|nr:TonB-dependent receptor [Candidatus Litorirhabdus singularis]MCX2982251.1 TonB-dependent receptor [Candidatus Litorirhabdus singularis]
MRRTPLAIAVAVATLHSGFAAAQLEEVIVTAQKKDELLSEAPVAVNVIGARQIEEFSVFQADELGKLTAGLDIRFEGDTNTGVGLRGVGTFSQQAAPARVGTYLDDYYMASQAATALGGMYDMDSVQILRGPQGTLYGQPSPTGAMIMKTADPDLTQVNGYVQGSVVDPSGYNLQGAVSVPIIKDKLAIRIAALTDKRESGIENIVRNETDERGRDAFRIKLLWEPTDDLSMLFGYHRVETDDSDLHRIVETIDSDLANYNVQADDRYAIGDAPSVMNEKEDDFYTFKLDWALGDIDVSWFTGLLTSEYDTRNDNDNTDIPSVVLYNAGTYGGSVNDNFQHELRISSAAFDDRWEWTVGAYYSDAAAQTDVRVDQVIEGVGVFQIFLDIPTATTTSAIFTHNTFNLTDDTSLTVGLRYNEFESESANIIDGDFLLGAVMEPGGELTDPTVAIPSVFPCPDGSASPCFIGDQDKQEEWTGTIKLAHQFSDALNMYGTLDRGYRPGAPNFDTTGIFQATPEDPDSDLNNYTGESVESFELGMKGNFLDGRARYSAAFFYSLYEDYQVQVGFEAYNVTSGDVEIAGNRPYVNVDEAEQLGLEGELKMLITDNWSLFASATYAKVEFTDGEVPCTDPNGPPVDAGNRFNTCDASGEQASEQPEFFGTLQSEYVFPQLLFGADAYLSGLVVYRGKTEVPGDIEARFEADSFTTLDLYTGLRSDTWSVQVFGKNMTDEDGVLAKRAASDAYNELTLTPPRTYGVTASYRF